MHLPTTLPELWVTKSPLGEPEQLLILKKHTRVPRQALPGPNGGGEKATPFPLLPVMQEVPGQTSCKCGPVLISDHQAGWMQQAASVLQMLCETGPAHPVCVCLCNGNTLVGCCRREPGGSCHTHTQLAELLCWSLVDPGGMLFWAHSCQKSCWLHSLAVTADSSLSRPLSILSPPQRLTSGLQISIFLWFLVPTPLYGVYKESLNVGGNVWHSPGWAGT
jgi:hypothetical protein